MLLPVPPAVTVSLIGARLSGRTGIGALLRNVVTQSSGSLSSYTPSDAIRISTVLIDLVAALVAHEMESPAVLPTESGWQVLYLQVQAFIQRRLGEPDLTPAMIAEAHHVSVRTLQRVFESNGCTIAKWIRDTSPGSLSARPRRPCLG